MGKYIDKSTFDSSKLRKSDDQQKAIEQLVKRHNVLLENVMIAHVFQRWCDLAKKHGKYRFFYLKVDENECINRVLKRRNPNDKTLKLENKNHRFFSTIQKTIDNLEAEGCWVKTLDHPTKKEAYQTVMKQIKKDLKEQDTTEGARYSVFDIRGTNGSGKSSLVRNILKRHKNELKLDEDIPYHFIPELNLCVLGRYDKKGSGVDNVKGSDRLQAFMRDKLKHHNVMLEGVIVSHVFERWNKMAESPEWGYTFFHLKVDIDECIDRVKARRKAIGKNPEYDPKNTVRFAEQTDRTIKKLISSGRTVVVLENASQKEAYKTVMKHIKKAVKEQKED